jgi:hypothetical protein
MHTIALPGIANNPLVHIAVLTYQPSPSYHPNKHSTVVTAGMWGSVPVLFVNMVQRELSLVVTHTQNPKTNTQFMLLA